MSARVAARRRQEPRPSTSFNDIATPREEYNLNNLGFEDYIVTLRLLTDGVPYALDRPHEKHREVTERLRIMVSMTKFEILLSLINFRFPSIRAKLLGCFFAFLNFCPIL